MPTDKLSANVSTDDNGRPIGAAIFLSADALRELGLSPETTDTFQFWVENGQLQLSPEKDE